MLKNVLKSSFIIMLVLLFQIAGISYNKVFAHSGTITYQQKIQNTNYYPENRPIDTPKIRWNYQIDEEGIEFTSMAISEEGTLFAGSLGGKLYAFNPDGTLKWSKQIEKLGFSIEVSYNDGTIYVSTGLGNVFAVDKDGNVKWSLNVGNYSLGKPVIDELDNVYVACYSNTGTDKICAIGKNGIIYFQTNLNSNKLLSDIAIDSNKNVLYVATGDGKIYAIDLSVKINLSANSYTVTPPGNILWTYQSDSVSKYNINLVVDSNGMIYFTSKDALYSLNPNGKVNWVYKFTDILPNVISTDSNNVYIGSARDNGDLEKSSNNAKIYAITNSGALKWVYPTNDKEIESILIDKNNNIYYVSYDGSKSKLSSINPNSTERWTFTDDSWAKMNILVAPILDKDSRIYINSFDKIYMLSDKAFPSVKRIELWIGKNYYRVNGNKYTMDTAPFIDKSGRTIVPLRFISYALGVSSNDINWDNKTQTVTINFKSKVIKFVVGKNTYTVNGVIYKMDTVPINKNNRVMVPIRYVANSMGCSVSYDERSGMITIIQQEE